jgi:hypothetical protein
VPRISHFALPRQIGKTLHDPLREPHAQLGVLSLWEVLGSLAHGHLVSLPRQPKHLGWIFLRGFCRRDLGQQPVQMLRPSLSILR